MFVPKTIAFVLIATILLETIAAAPMVDDSATQTTKTQKSRPPPKHPRKKNLASSHENYLKGWNRLLNETTWENPCSSIAWESDRMREDNFNDTYTTLRNNVRYMMTQLTTMDRINQSEIVIWEEFHAKNYSFLPNRPSGRVAKWHPDMQKMVAAFSVLAKLQYEKESTYNNKTVTCELEDLFEQARTLLCDIEHFYNATYNRDGLHSPYIFERREMAQILKFKKDRHIDNIFLKARFQEYLKRLSERLKNFNLEANLTPMPEKKSFNHKRGKIGKRRQHRRRTTTNPSGSTDNFTIVRTSKGTRKPKRGMKLLKKQQRQQQQELQAKAAQNAV